jgi:hypothetical protein
MEDALLVFPTLMPVALLMMSLRRSSNRAKHFCALGAKACGLAEELVALKAVTIVTATQVIYSSFQNALVHTQSALEVPALAMKNVIVT